MSTPGRARHRATSGVTARPGRHEEDRRQRRARAQPQEHRRGDPTRQAHGDHRPVGFGQILAGLRHHLCRRPAPLRRISLGLRAPISRTAGKPDVDSIDGLSPAIAIEQKTAAATRAPASAPSPKSTITCAFCGRAWARSTAGNVASAFSRRPFRRWWIACSVFPTARAFPCCRPWCATRRATTPARSLACARTASCAPTSTVSCANWRSRPSSTNRKSTPSRSSSTAWFARPASSSAWPNPSS